MRIAKEIVDFANLFGKYLEWLAGTFRAEGAGSVWGKNKYLLCISLQQQHCLFHMFSLMSLYEMLLGVWEAIYLNIYMDNVV